MVPARITYLDGWRAIAVGLVIAAHGAENFFGTHAYSLGFVGVDIFFLISGYIITSLTVREIQATGAFSQSKFMLRRAFRILPPLLLFVAAMAVLGEATLAQAAFGASFTCNMAFADCGWIMGHTWSLSFEEQFYLLFPFLVLRKWRWLVLVVAAIYVLPLAYPVNWIGRVGFFQIAALFGCGAAFAVWGDQIRPHLARVPLLLLALCAVGLVGWFALPIGTVRTILAPAVPLLALLVVFGLPIKASWFEAALSSWPMRTIGLYSYSVYLWQQYFLRSEAGDGALNFAIAVGLTLALSAASYHTFERVFRVLSRRYASVTS